MLRKSLVCFFVLSLVSVAQAEAIRTRLTKENRFPSLYRPEIGVQVDYTDFEKTALSDRTTTVVTPYLRYRLLEELTIFGKVPYVSVSDNIAGDESGWGDASVGAEILAFEDIFKYPWVMPHIEYVFDSGDEDKGLGRGEAETIVGLAMGTTVNEIVHFAVDGRYHLFDTTDDYGSAAASIIWDISEKFSWLAEIEYADNKELGQSDGPVTWLGGLFWTPHKDFSISLEAGGVENSSRDTIGSARVALSF